MLSKIPSSAIHSNDKVIKGQQNLRHKGSLAERFEGARQIFTRQLLEEIFSFVEIETAVNVLAYQLKEANDKFNNEAAGWIKNIKQQLATDKEAGIKFIPHIVFLLREEPVIEKNVALQKRINEAANYFEPRYAAHQQTIQNNPLITEHKDAAAIINENLLQLISAVHSANYYLQYCKQAFSVTGFLQHKLKFAQPRFIINCYVTGKKQSVTNTPNAELYETLKRWRDMVCEEDKSPVYMVANQASLKEISTYLPLNKKDLLLITGFGKAKADKYGSVITELVEDYCNRHNLETNIDAKKKKN